MESTEKAWLYTVEWTPRGRAPGVVVTGDVPPDRWLIFLDDHGVGLRLAARLAARGFDCITVSRSASSGEPYADPSRPETFRARLSELVDGAESLGAVYLWPLDAPGVEDAPGDAHVLPCAGSIGVVKAIALDALIDRPRLWLVTAGAQPVCRGEAPHVAQAAAWGLAKTVAFEHPELRCRRIDLDPEGVTQDPEAAADLLLEEVIDGDDEDEIAFRDETRYVPRLRLAVPPEHDARYTPVALAPEGTYLLTGGLGSIGLRVAEWMVRGGARRLVLVGRSEPSARGRDTVERLRRAGAEVIVRQADVARAPEVAALVAAVGPRLRGVVHLAGTFDDSDVITLDDRVLADVMAARAYGAWNLHAATRGLALDFFVLFSSTASVMGSPGQGAFAASNAFVDALAFARRAAGLCATAINWGPWGEPNAAGADVVSTIDPRAGCELLGRLLGGPRAQVVVTGQEIGALLRFYPRAGSVRAFEDVLPAGGRPGVDRYERRDLSASYVAPRDRTERLIARIVARAMGLDTVGVKDDFFELGGDSVVGAGILSRVAQLFDVEVSFEDAIEAFTIERLADIVRAHGATSAGAEDAGAEAAPPPL